MNLTLRPVGVREALGFEAFLEEAVGESCEALGAERPPPGTVRACLERVAERAETLVLFAEDAPGAPVALCISVPLRDPLTDEGMPMVVALWVEPRLRHRGVARAMMLEHERLLRARGVRALAVRASHNDDALISMGERWGFVRAWELLVRE